MEKLKKEQIDWTEYRQNLIGSISNERIWALGYCGKNGSNPHIENCNKLEEEIRLLDNGDYDSILDLHSDALDYFDDFLLKPKTAMENKIDSFWKRITNLRRELIDSIIGVLTDNNLTEIKLSRQPDKQPWVVWFDNRDYGYDSRVTKVFLGDKGIAIEIYDDDCGCSTTLTSDNADLACTNIDWLCNILNCINYTLNLPQSNGNATIAGQIIEWSYDEPGLSALPEDDIEEIKTKLADGIHEGELCYYDEYDVEFNGTWKIKPNL